MNRQGNLYTIIYIVALVVVVGAALAFTSISLKDRQQANVEADKMAQILASVQITPEPGQVIDDYKRFITDTYCVDMQGNRIEGATAAFDVDVDAQSKEAPDKRLLPVYECTLDDGSVKYIMPMYGAGLWGPIWGYISVDADGSTIYGTYFAHQGETPGLGAEIEKPKFREQFDGKHLIKNGAFVPVAVVKHGLAPQGNEDYVDGISGGTITSKGVGAMIDNCLSPYSSFLENLQAK
ncbi:MAG: NADH:ubiquinone reductase (Na(+)-transporting) subunit C [Muribaculaceae bacterium]|nr:NADH:ubiquinone reductase (Na(+)-transporting) subunit C [Muribaculaceae bacterium]